MSQKIRDSKLKVSTLDDLTITGFENTSNNKSFLDKKKFIIISFCIIISIILIILTLLYALKIDFANFFRDVHQAINNNSLAPLWLTLLVLYIPFKLYSQVTIYIVRIRRLGIKVKFWESLLYTLTVSFLTAISPANFLVDSYNAFWLKTRNIEMYKVSAITICTMLTAHAMQILVTIPSYIIVCINYNLFINSGVETASWIFWFVTVGLIVDLCSLFVLIITGTSRHVHLWISLLWNKIKKTLHMPYLPKHHVVFRYVSQAIMKKEFKRLFADLKITIYCVIVCIINEIFFYFTAVFALKFILPKDAHMSIFGVFNSANVAITANKFIPIPGGEYTSEQFLSVFCQVLGKIDRTPAEIENYVNNSVLVWRFDTTYLLSMIGFFGFVVYLANYITRIVALNKMIRQKKMSEQKYKVLPQNLQKGNQQNNMKEIKIRTRYAPSPTGYFHIGGARTALFNYLYAKHMHGDFIVRIEDTDFERNVEGGTESQLENLKWMGIQPDESPLNPKRYGPYVQSQKLDRYQQLVVKLIGEGKAYYCFCTPEQLEADRQLALKNHQTPKYNRRCLNLTEQEIKEKLKNNHNVAVRLKMEDNVNIEWDDLVRGHMCVPTSALTDPVILKSNGYPMYNFAVVVDDYDMKITHILRGEEHLSNTPYQIAIKKALGFDNQDIKYGHLSIITDETGKKLSKRNKELKQFIEDYRNMGVPAEALNNFLALLGWSSKTNKEVLPINELIKEFDFDRISKAPAFFDFKKLLWMSNQYIKAMPLTNYLKFVKKYLNVDLSKICDEKHHDILLEMFQPQLQYGLQINDLINDLFGNVTKKELSDEIKSFMKKASSIKVLTNFKKQLNNIDELNLENSTQIVNNIKTEESIKGKELFLPIRIVCIYKEHGPEINKIMTIIGKQKILENIEGIIG